MYILKKEILKLNKHYLIHESCEIYCKLWQGFDKKEISKSDVLPWSYNLIKRFEENWDWDELNRNNAILWNIGLIDSFFKYIKWDILSANTSVLWTTELLIKYQNLINFRMIANKSNLDDKVKFIICENLYKIERKKSGGYGYDVFHHLSDNLNMPWTEEFIEKYKYKISWFKFSNNCYVPWSIELIENFIDFWHWGHLGENPSLPWSISLIDNFKDFWVWFHLSRNENLPWTMKLIEKFYNRWHWIVLSENRFIPWPIDFLEYKFDRQCWKCLKNISWVTHYKNIETQRDKVRERCWAGLSSNYYLPWSEEFINKYIENWNWDNLSNNPALPWSLEFIDTFKEKWNWHILSSNPHLNIQWSAELLIKFRNKWTWTSKYIKKGNDHAVNPYGSICANSSIKWSIELIGPIKNEVDFWLLSLKGNINFEIVEKYFDKWTESRIYMHHSLKNSDFGYYSHDEKRTGWDNLCENHSLVWNDESIEKYFSNLNFYHLAKYGNLNMSWITAMKFPSRVKAFSPFYWDGRYACINQILKKRGYNLICIMNTNCEKNDLV